MTSKEFKVSEYITLNMEQDQTFIYVNGERFDQCKYLAFQIDAEETELYEGIQSIDEMEQQDRAQGFKNLNISPEEEFWGHCSNLQAWVENGYDTRLLHRNLAFPLLKKLTQVGDPIAKKVFKEEIIYRLEEDNVNVVRYLFKEGYLDNFSKEEIGFLFNSIKSPIVKLALFGIQIDAPHKYYEKLDKLKGNAELIIWAFKNYEFFRNFPFLLDYYDELMKDPELAKWAIENQVHKVFYDNFNVLKENPDLAKWGIENNAPYEFYENFDIITQNVELAKWGIKNNAPDTFYRNIPAISENPSKINALSLSRQLKEKFLREFPKDIKIKK